MYKENSMIKNAVAAMQAATKEGNEEQIKASFEKFGEAIAATVQADFENAHGDKNVLLQRGFRVLTNAEQKFYEKIIEAGKEKTVQAMNGLLTPEVMPTTIIEDVYRNLTTEHPLLNRINFQSVAYLTRWILNDHSVQSAKWGKINEAVAKEISSAFQVVEVTQCKLSAFAVIELDMLELGPVFLDGYIRTFLQEALAVALESAIISGTGHNEPIGMIRDIHKGVLVNTDTGYPEKEAIKVTSFLPEEYGKVLAKLAVTESYEDENDTKHGGNMRKFDGVTLICNQVDFLTKIMPATTVLTTNGQYATNVFPFPTEVIRSNEMPTGKTILCLPEEYFMGVGTGKTGTITFSDDFKFLDDQRVFKIKMHGMGKPFDNTVAIVLDISELDPAYITVKNMENVTVA